MRTKQVKHKNIEVELSFQSGQVIYKVVNGPHRAWSDNLHEALGKAKVEGRKTNHLIRGVKQELGL